MNWQQLDAIQWLTRAQKFLQLKADGNFRVTVKTKIEYAITVFEPHGRVIICKGIDCNPPPLSNSFFN